MGSESFYRERWWQRIQRERRRTFFQKIGDKEYRADFSIKQVLNWMRNDVVYGLKWGVNILLQLRAYGTIIKKNYGISIWQQFVRMSYLAFIRQVDPGNFRGRQLYLPQSWKYVDDYTYSHDRSQFYLVGCSSPDEVELFGNKLKFFEFSRSHNIQTPDILAAFNRGEIIWPEDSSFELPEANLFVKYMDGKAGQGTRKLVFSSGLYRQNNGSEYSKKDLADHLLKESKKKGIILQKALNNHASWQKFTSGALATCRIVTAKLPEDNRVQPLFSSLRMPVGNAEIDNFSKGGFYSSVDLKTGILGRAKGLKPVKESFEFSNHPNTGGKVEGTQLPFWEVILDFTLNVHSSFKILFVGWDISMTEEGPVVIEGNIGWASRSYESANLRPLRETNYPVLYEKWIEKYADFHE